MKTYWGSGCIAPRIRALQNFQHVHHAARMAEMRNTYKISVGKPERKSPLRIPKRR